MMKTLRDRCQNHLISSHISRSYRDRAAIQPFPASLRSTTRLSDEPITVSTFHLYHRRPNSAKYREYRTLPRRHQFRPLPVQRPRIKERHDDDTNVSPSTFPSTSFISFSLRSRSFSGFLPTFLSLLCGHDVGRINNIVVNDHNFVVGSQLRFGK